MRVFRPFQLLLTLFKLYCQAEVADYNFREICGVDTEDVHKIDVSVNYSFFVD